MGQRRIFVSCYAQDSAAAAAAVVVLSGAAPATRSAALVNLLSGLSPSPTMRLSVNEDARRSGSLPSAAGEAGDHREQLSGSTGFATCIWKPARTAFIRSSARKFGNGITGECDQIRRTRLCLEASVPPVVGACKGAQFSLGS